MNIDLILTVTKQELSSERLTNTYFYLILPNKIKFYWRNTQSVLMLCKNPVTVNKNKFPKNFPIFLKILHQAVSCFFIFFVIFPVGEYLSEIYFLLNLTSIFFCFFIFFFFIFYLLFYYFLKVECKNTVNHRFCFLLFKKRLTKLAYL